MALEQKELWSSISTSPAPRIEAEDAAIVRFAPDAGASAVELGVGLPMVYDKAAGTDGQWTPWVNADTHIDGFIHPEPVMIQATGGDDVLGVVMTSGQIHYGDVLLPAGQTQGTLDGILKDNPTINRRLRIDGLKEVR